MEQSQSLEPQFDSNDFSGYKWFLFPARGSHTQTLLSGQRVFLTPKGVRDWACSRDWVVLEHDSDGHSTISRRLDPTSRKRVQTSSLNPILNTTVPNVIVCPDTQTFRRLANSQVLPGDRVLEIGCSFGETTTRLARAVKGELGQEGGKIIAVELTDQLIAAAKVRCSRDSEKTNVEFVKMDAISEKSKLLSFSSWASVVFIDIGGDRESETVKLLLGFILKWAFHRLVVVKSEELASDLNSAIERLDISQYPDGYLENAPTWFFNHIQAIEVKNSSNGIGHPLQQARHFAPHVGLEICRYFNYLDCKRGSECPFDHRHCHICFKLGHNAMACSQFSLTISQELTMSSQQPSLAID